MTNPQKSRALWWLAIGFYCLAALGAAYLLYYALKDGSVAGCGKGAGAGCNLVQGSRWAYLFPGVPVTVPALLLYLTLLFGMLFKPRSELWIGVFLVGALTIIGAALWFTGLQAIAIKAFCKRCLLVHAAGIAGSLCLLLALRPVPRELKPFGVGAAALALALLAGVQVIFPARTSKDMNLGSGGLSGSGKVVEIGGLPLNLGQMPHRGNIESSRQMVMLFDYTCQSCRRIHGYLERAEKRFGKDNYLVVMLPTPLNPDCNSHLKEEMPDHRNACLFAKIGFALWGLDREKFYEWDEWMIKTGTPRYPPDAQAGRAKAEELVGKDVLAKAIGDPVVAQKIEHTTKIWQLMREKSGRMTMPKMLWSNGNLTEGAAGSEFELYNSMEQQLGLRRVN